MDARLVLGAAAVTLVAMIGFLFSPRVPRGQEDLNCVSVTDIGPMHIHKNCDSEEFEYVAADPGLLLAQRRYRQSRPLYAVLGWTFARPFHWLGLQSVGRPIIANAKQSYPKGPAPAEYLPEYAGFVTLNFALLVTAVMLFLKLSGAQGLFDPLTLLPLAMIVVNEVTKAAFWTPHLQIFNVLVPIASVALYHRMLDRRRELTWLQILSLGFAIGLGSLIYGAFAVMAAGAALCALVGGGNTTRTASLFSRWMKSGLLIVAFFVPMVAWITFVKYKTGSFYSLEIDLNRDFVWIVDVLRRRGLVGFLWMFLIQTELYGESIRSVFPFPVAALGILTGLLVWEGRVRETVSANRMLIESMVLYAAPCFLFYWLLGFYHSRLTWSLVPPMALLIAIETRSLERVVTNRGKFRLRAASLVVTVFYLAFWYVRPGPWS